MKNTFFLFFLFVFLSACKEKPESSSITKKVLKTEQLQMSLDSIFNAHPASTGLMVHVEAPDQGMSWSGAVGVSDKETGAVLKANQPALIASNTKTYTAVAMLRLVEKGHLTLDQSIDGFLSSSSAEALTAAGYDLKAISIAHLLSHTSGIRDYVNEDYMMAIDKDKKHRWTRDEQIALSIKAGEPLGAPGDLFSYADVNFLLATEIIEHFTKLPYYQALRALIDYEKQGMVNTWFVSLEEVPTGTAPMARQYFSEMGWDSYSLDPSFDLYGAGGIAAPTKDLALFSQRLFEGDIIEDKAILNLIYTKMPIREGEDPHYYMGMMDSEISGYKAYGHGGFWGTSVKYFPELNASVAVYVLERDNRILRKDILETMSQLIGKHQADPTTNSN